ncbi:hypothetical protein Ancab_004804 [Ancistrocladus abbreviatus]
MKAPRKIRLSSSSSSTFIYTFRNDHSTPQEINQVPIELPEVQSPIPMAVHLPNSPSTTTESSSSAAAAKIQAAYRSYLVRNLVKRISAVKSETDRLERLIQRQETVDAVRNDEKERLRIHEALMSQLLKLDSVPGFDPTVRDLRRRVSHRIVGLQEIVDAICGERIDGWDEVIWRNWDEVIEEMEEEVCRKRGGDELERYCAEKLGFRCLQRFLRDY